MLVGAEWIRDGSAVIGALAAITLLIVQAARKGDRSKAAPARKEALKPPAETLVCRSCGEGNPAGRQTCQQCGNKLV